LLWRGCPPLTPRPVREIKIFHPNGPRCEPPGTERPGRYPSQRAAPWSPRYSPVPIPACPRARRARRDWDCGSEHSGHIPAVDEPQLLANSSALHSGRCANAYWP
jgi:hypothetical protein